MAEWSTKDFSRIVERYFGRGFANITKTEAEVYLFDAYLSGLEREGTVPSYHQIGRRLGIADSKVRNLMQKRSLMFEDDPGVEECLLHLMEHAPKDLRDTNRVRIQINDVRYLYAIQDLIESKRLAYEPELTGKALVMSLADFLLLIEDTFGRDRTNDALRRLGERFKENGEQFELATSRSLREIAKDPTTYCELLAPLLFEGNIASVVSVLAQFLKEGLSIRR